jgi:photosystem II stability/assembly factor-like uncharacterized protein
LDVSSFAIDPVGPQTVYAGTSNGLFKSTNAGRSWRSSSRGLDTMAEIEVQTLAIDPLRPTTLFAGLWGAGIFKSSNSGRTWVNVLRGVTVEALAIDPRTPRNVYAATGRGLYKSTDRGQSWHSLALDGDVERLAIDPQRPRTLYAAGYDVFKSTDGGRVWRELKSGLEVDPQIPAIRRVQALAIDPHGPGNIVAATILDVPSENRDAGVFRSTNGGRTWSPFNDGLPNLTVTALAFARAGRVLYASTSEGVFAHRPG